MQPQRFALSQVSSLLKCNLCAEHTTISFLMLQFFFSFTFSVQYKRCKCFSFLSFFPSFFCFIVFAFNLTFTSDHMDTHTFIHSKVTHTLFKQTRCCFLLSYISVGNFFIFFFKFVNPLLRYRGFPFVAYTTFNAIIVIYDRCGFFFSRRFSINFVSLFSVCLFQISIKIPIENGSQASNVFVIKIEN